MTRVMRLLRTAVPAERQTDEERKAECRSIGDGVCLCRSAEGNLYLGEPIVGRETVPVVLLGADGPTRRFAMSLADACWLMADDAAWLFEREA